MENGKIAIVNNLKNGIGFGSTEFHVIRLSKQVILNKFVFFYLLRKALRRDARRKMSGSAGQLRVPSHFIEQVQIPLPPLQEQHRIVSKLEELITKLNAGIESLKKIQILLKQYRQAVLTYAYEGKLTENWRLKMNDKIVSGSSLLEKIILDRKTENKKYYQLPVNVDENLFRIPAKWVWTTLGTLFDVRPGSTPSRAKKEYWNGNISWVSSSEVSNRYISSTREKITKLALKNSSTRLNPINTVLIAMIGEGKTRGQTAILKIPAATNQNVAAIRCNLSPIPSEYIYYWTKNRPGYPEAKNYVTLL